MTDIDRTERDEAARSWRRFFLGLLVLLLIVFAFALRGDYTAIHPVAAGNNGDTGGSNGGAAPAQTTAPTQAPATPPASPAPAPTPTAPPTVPATPGAAEAATKALIAYTKSPAAYISKELYDQAKQQHPGSSQSELAAFITPPGLQLTPDAKTWRQSNATVGYLETTAVWTGQTTPTKFEVAMIFEDKTWKVLAIRPLPV